MNSEIEIRIYKKSDECISFRKTTEEYGGLSNMASGYPIVVNGIYIKSSEALYQALKFPHLPNAQKEIIAEYDKIKNPKGAKSPMGAKMKSKKYNSKIREDWDQIKIIVMRWVLRVKLIQNQETFGKLLLETGSKTIVEESKKDDFWGAKLDNNEFKGMNILGRLLMELRELYKQYPLDSIEPLKLKDFKLFGKSITSVEKLNNKEEFMQSTNLFNHENH